MVASSIGSLFGGGGSSSASPDLANRLGSQIRLPGLTVKTPGLELGTFQTNARATRGLTTSSALAGIRGATDEARAGLTGLLDQVSPGFGRLTESRVLGVQNAARRAIGNLRENLGQRRISGSSFGQDALARAEREFGEAEAGVRAQSFLEELDLSQRLLSERLQVTTAPDLLDLEQSNFEAGLATQLATGFGQLAVSNTRTIADILVSNAGQQGRAQEGLGNLLGLAGGALLGPSILGAGQAINPFGLPTASVGTA